VPAKDVPPIASPSNDAQAIPSPPKAAQPIASPSKDAQPSTEATRGSGSSEVPPPIVLSEAPTPPYGIPKFSPLESRPRAKWRHYVPSFEQWMIAAACIVAAAAVGFAVGRWSAPANTPTAMVDAQHLTCPDPAAHPVPAAQPANARDIVAPPEPRAETTTTAPIESVSVPPPASSAPDPAAQQATEKAIARAMSRGARRAASCRGASSPSGIAHVTATFLPTGEVKSATVRGAPFAGTAEGECIVRWFRPLRVPPFTGENISARKDFTLE
jgi:hypothetical protein